MALKRYAVALRPEHFGEKTPVISSHEKKETALKAASKDTLLCVVYSPKGFDKGVSLWADNFPKIVG